MPKDTTFTLINNLRDKKSFSVKSQIDKIADLSSNVLLFGETGVGKDFWVNYLFETSKYNKILNLNCGDVPEYLLESEWFGYKKGAYTGANNDYEGKWKNAENGILYLNQIDLLSLNLQSKLLRIIERKRYFPLGSNTEVEIDVRFIFSADSDIEQKVVKGKFREDLYYRISSYQIFIPPLRDRKDDILPLISFFAREKNLKLHLSKKAINFLLNYYWRGNIREVENFINYVSVTSDELSDRSIFSFLKTSDDFIENFKAKDVSLSFLEKEYIFYLLKKYKNKTQVAKILKISRKSLYNKLKKYGQN